MSIRTRALRAVAVAAALTLVPLVGLGTAHADATLPGAITNLKTFTHVGAVTFSWDIPDDSALPAEQKTVKTLIQARIGRTAPSAPNDPSGILDSDAVSCSPAGPGVSVCAPGDVTWIDGLDPGTDFTFSFWVVDAGGDLSAKVSSTLYATDLVLKSSRSSLTYGTATTFTAQLRRTGSGVPVAGVKVDLYVRARGTRAWYFWHEGTTNGAGVVSSSFKPGLGIDVQAYFYGEGSNLGTATSGITVGVRAKVTASVSHRVRKKGKPFTIRGVVASKAPGSVAWIERRSKGTWKRVKTVRLTSVRTSAGTTSGRVTYKVKPKKKGRYSYRVTSPASAKYLVSSSNVVRFRVR